MFSRDRQPPAGWGAPLGVLEPTEIVVGFHARHQELKGVCHRRDCRRTTTIDLEAMIAKHLHRLSKRDIYHLYRCNRFEGCGLELHTDPHVPTLALASIAGVPGIATRIKCRGCGFMRRYTVEELIAQLVAAKRGDERTNVMEVAALFKSPCKQCKKTDWDFHVLWPTEDTMAWRTGQRP